MHNIEIFHIHKQWINTYLLVEAIQETSYERAMLHLAIGTLSITLSLCRQATSNLGYASTKGGTTQAHSQPHITNSLFPSWINNMRWMMGINWRMDGEEGKINYHGLHDFWVKKTEPIFFHMKSTHSPCSINSGVDVSNNLHTL